MNRGLDFVPAEKESLPDDTPVIVVMHGLTGGLPLLSSASLPDHLQDPTNPTSVRFSTPPVNPSVKEVWATEASS